MHVTIVSLLFLLLFSPEVTKAADYKFPNKHFTATIRRVHDGDTVTAVSLANNKAYQIRLLEIDAPEINPAQPWGKEAQKALADLVLNKKVHIYYDSVDKYGRTLGNIVLDNFSGDVNKMIDVNGEMVFTGNAWVYREYPHDKMLEKWESDAKTQQLGLWSLPNPIYPHMFRENHKKGVKK